MIGATHYADLRGPAACELLTDAEVDAIHAASATTRCATTPTRTAPGPGSPAPAHRWPPC